MPVNSTANPPATTAMSFRPRAATAGSAGAAGHGEDRALEGVGPVVCAALDGGVGLGRDTHGGDEADGAPAAGLALGALDFPGRHTEGSGELVRAAAAGTGDTGDRTDAVG